MHVMSRAAGDVGVSPGVGERTPLSARLLRMPVLGAMFYLGCESVLLLRELARPRGAATSPPQSPLPSDERDDLPGDPRTSAQTARWNTDATYPGGPGS